jgi:hypothetical protein
LINFNNTIGHLRDDDADGSSVYDDPPDCDDSDAEVYPGAPTDCTDTYLRSGDRDCDGITDSVEYGTCPNSPIVLDVLGNGLSLTSRDSGVLFNLNNNGDAELIPWTVAGSDDAWLALDRNENGTIDDGAELFGNFTNQPPSAIPNGFEALAVFDKPASGGNNDGWIDREDEVWSRLRLWTDSNHDGVSQPTELRGLASAGLRRFSLHYTQLNWADQFGNWFRFRARVVDQRGRDIGPWAYDVFLGGRQPIGKPRRR